MQIRAERWAQFAPDFLPIWRDEHAPEIWPPGNGHVDPPVMDQEQYETIDQAGMLHILTARKGGALQGYVVGIVTPHLNLGILTYFSSLHYVVRAHRRQGIGGCLFGALHDDLRQRGVKAAFTTNKLFQPYAGFLLDQKYEPLELVFVYWL